MPKVVPAFAPAHDDEDRVTALGSRWGLWLPPAVIVLTVWAAYQNFGAMNIVIALGIATIKAILVILFFMHGKYSARRTKLVIVSGFFWLAIMLGLTLQDYFTRHPEPSRSQLQGVSVFESLSA